VVHPQVFSSSLLGFGFVGWFFSFWGRPGSQTTFINFSSLTRLERLGVSLAAAGINAARWVLWLWAQAERRERASRARGSPDTYCRLEAVQGCWRRRFANQNSARLKDTTRWPSLQPRKRCGSLKWLSTAAPSRRRVFASAGGDTVPPNKAAFLYVLFRERGGIISDSTGLSDTLSRLLQWFHSVTQSSN